jgi:hypothetical protein
MSLPKSYLRIGRGRGVEGREQGEVPTRPTGQEVQGVDIGHVEGATPGFNKPGPKKLHKY